MRSLLGRQFNAQTGRFLPGLYCSVLLNKHHSSISLECTHRLNDQLRPSTNSATDTILYRDLISKSVCIDKIENGSTSLTSLHYQVQDRGTIPQINVCVCCTYSCHYCQPRSVIDDIYYQ